MVLYSLELLESQKMTSKWLDFRFTINIITLAHTSPRVTFVRNVNARHEEKSTRQKECSNQQQALDLIRKCLFRNVLLGRAK